MAFCVNCGKEMDADWNACPSCGTMKDGLEAEKEVDPETNDSEKETLELIKSGMEKISPRKLNVMHPEFRMEEGDIEGAISDFQAAAKFIQETGVNSNSISEILEGKVDITLLWLAKYFKEIDDFSSLERVCTLNDILFPKDAGESESGQFSLWDLAKAVVADNQGSSGPSIFSVDYLGRDSGGGIFASTRCIHRFVITESEQSTEFTICPKGKLSGPLLNSVKIDGEVIAELQKEVTLSSSDFWGDFTLPTGKSYSVKISCGKKGTTVIESASFSNAAGSTQCPI